MPSTPTCEWVGKSGSRYTFVVYELPVHLTPFTAGNYIYARLTADREWVPVYIGEGILCDKCSDAHHDADEIRRRGATHFHCHVNCRVSDRRGEHQDLLERYPTVVTTGFYDK